MVAKRIAIIGAGASGITAIKCCLDEGLVPVCFERTGEIGGLWNFTPSVREDQACIMKSTVINTSKEMMPYSDFPIPAEFPNFMHNTKVMEYFHMYVKHFDLEKYIRFRTTILKAKQTDDFNTSGQWVLEIQHVNEEGEPTGEVSEETFDAVISCTGHHATKRMPYFKGQETFTGKIVHPHDYKDHQGYEGKRVVVIGIGNSGGDVSVELSKIASQVYLSTRRGTWVINRVSRKGMPADLVGTRRVVETLKKLIGYNASCNIGEMELNARFNHEMYGLKPSHRCFSQHPMVNDELPNRIVCGSIIVKPDVKYIQGSSVHFNDDTIVDDVDVIITATGYKFGFPYIDEKVIKVVDNRVDLFKYVFPPDLTHPTLAVIGCIQPWGAIMPISELQCRWATSVFKGSTKLPSHTDMWIDIRKTQNAMKERYVTSPRHTIQVDWIPFMDEVAEQFGCKPDFKALLFSDPKLAFQCYFGPCTPYQYRLHGPLPWKGARDAIMTTWDRVYEPFKSRVAEPSPQSQSNIWKIFLFVVILAIVLAFIF